MFENLTYDCADWKGVPLDVVISLNKKRYF